MAELVGFGLFEGNRAPRRWPTQRNTSLLDDAVRQRRNSPYQQVPSIAGNAMYSSQAETSAKGKWKMSDVGLRNSRSTIISKAKEGLEGLKTGRIAQKLGEIAVANDLAYVPRMSEDALVGINEDESHSRNSYVQVHHAAIDFTRQLPKGAQPAFFNPSTHILVPRQDEQRPHTIPSMQAEQLQEPLLDLLDLELMAHKPPTMPTIMPNMMVSTMENTGKTKTDVPSTRQRANSRPGRTQRGQWQVPIQPGQSTAPQPHIQITLSQGEIDTIHNPLDRPTDRSFVRRPSKIHGNSRLDDRSELYLTLPPKSRDHTTFDVLSADQQASTLPRMQTNLSRPHKTQEPASSAHPANLDRSRPTNRHHLPAPPATWAAPLPVPYHTLPSNRPQRPATMNPVTLPFEPEDDPLSGPKTPPLSLEDVDTFSPKDKFVNDLRDGFARGNSEQQIRQSKSTRRATGVHRQKTSQEIWDDKFVAEQDRAREREMERAREREIEEELKKEQEILEQQKQQQQQRNDEEVKAAEAEMQKQQHQARETADFERRHRERVFAMQAEIAEDERRVRETRRREAVAAANNNSGLMFRPRPSARTFQPLAEEHPLRTRTGTLDETNREPQCQMRPTARTFQPDVEEHRLRTRTRTSVSTQLERRGDEAERVSQPQVRPTARTFHMNQEEHFVRPTTTSPQPQQPPQTQQPHPNILPPQQVHSQIQPQTNTNTNTNINWPPFQRPVQRSPEFRRWQPNSNARTFVPSEPAQDAGTDAATKGGRNWRR